MLTLKLIVSQIQFVETHIGTVVSNINHQGGLHSRILFRQAQQILLWAEEKFKYGSWA